MQRFKDTAGGPTQRPVPPWFAGAAIGLAILGMAGGAMALGTGLALSKTGCLGR
jgi:hypothetical protein